MILLGCYLLRILQCFLGFDSETVKVWHIVIILLCLYFSSIQTYCQSPPEIANGELKTRPKDARTYINACLMILRAPSISPFFVGFPRLNRILDFARSLEWPRASITYDNSSARDR